MKVQDAVLKAQKTTGIGSKQPELPGRVSARDLAAGGC